METNDQPKASEQEVVQPQTESTSQEETKFVPATAYKEVSSDMHKFKNRAREAEAKANELAERIKAIEEDKLKEQQRFEELYEREKAEREAELRKYSHRYKSKKPGVQMVEAVEVVDSDEE